MEYVSPAGPVFPAGTLSGNPLAMAAGLWSIGHLSKPLYARMARLGRLLAVGLAEAARVGRGAAGERARVAADAVLHERAGARLPLGAAGEQRAGVRRPFSRGMLARSTLPPPPSQFEAWFLSAAHAEADIRRTVRAARAAMDEAAEVE